MDFWTLITGVASILSLLFYWQDKNPKWKSYILPVATGLTGFSIGRFSVDPIVGETSRGVNFLLQDSFLVFIFLIFLIIAILIAIAMIISRKTGDARFVYLILMMLPLVLSGLNSLHYNFSLDKISATDYLELAIIKEDKQDYSNAIKYFEIYKNKVQDDKIRNQIEQKLEQIRQKQLE